MLDVQLTASATGEALHSAHTDGFETLITSTFLRTHGVFRTATHAVAGTTIMALPPSNGSIILSELVITSEKKNLGEIKVQFTDDVETEVLLDPIVTDAPANLALSIDGRWQGWRNARLEFITAAASFTATITAGYAKLSFGDPYAVWDERR